MNTGTRSLLFWAPRAICLAFAVFLSLFALDVFREGYSLGNTLLAFLIHLVPAFVVLVVLAVAWRWEWIGAAGLAALGLWYAKGNWRHHPTRLLVITAPLLVIAALFLVNWLKHDELRGGPSRQG
jgi:hypothetical protein